MATVIKKISELEHLEELTSSSNVIIEENGEAKRFSAASLGKVKTVNGVEPDENGNIEVVIPEVEIPEQANPDWNQNDPEQPDYVKNRTHWEENNQTVIEWDGDTEGRDSYDIFYKFSDLTPTKSNLVGGEIGLKINGEVQSLSLTEENVYELDGGLMIIDETILVVYQNTGDTFAQFPSTGIYAALYNGNHLTSLTYGSTTYHPLDEGFIPDTIARTADIPEVNYPVTSVNGMTGDVVIEAGSGGGVTSWNDLEDRPFYGENNKVAVVENEVVQLSAGGGSNYGGPTSSPIVLTAGEKYTVVVDGEEYVMTAYEGTMQGVSCVCLGDISILNDDNTTPDTPICLAYAASRSMTLVGVVGAIEEITLSVYKGSAIVHPLDDKFIPDTIARVTDIPIYQDERVVYVDSLGNVTYEMIRDHKIVICCKWNSGDDIYAEEYDCPLVIIPYGEEQNTDSGGVVMYYNAYNRFGKSLAGEICKSAAGEVTGSTIDREYHVVNPETAAIGQTIVVDTVFRGKARTWRAVNIADIIPKASAISNASGETVTAAEFNALLAALREAGYLAT